MTTFIENVFSEKTKKMSERIIINIAIFSFVVHLILILLIILVFLEINMKVLVFSQAQLLRFTHLFLLFFYTRFIY